MGITSDYIRPQMRINRDILIAHVSSVDLRFFSSFFTAKTHWDPISMRTLFAMTKSYDLNLKMFSFSSKSKDQVNATPRTMDAGPPPT